MFKLIFQANTVKIVQNYHTSQLVLTKDACSHNKVIKLFKKTKIYLIAGNFRLKKKTAVVW